MALTGYISGYSTFIEEKCVVGYFIHNLAHIERPWRFWE